MKAFRLLARAVLALALVATGAPLAATMCGGGAAAHCPMMAMGAGAAGCGAATWVPELSCCPSGSAPAMPAGAAALVTAAATAPPLAVVALAGAGVTPTLPSPAITLAAERSRAARRHELGLFTLFEVFRN